MRFKRTALRWMVLCLTVFALMPTHAAQASYTNEVNIVTPAYANISFIDSNLYISGSVAKILGEASSYNKKYVTITSTLQRYSSGNWVNVRTYSSSGYGYVSINKEYSLSSSGSYRVRTIASCSGETITKYSTIKIY